MMRDVLDWLWRKAALINEWMPGVKYGRQRRVAPFAWLADWLIGRGWLVGPEGGWYREFRWRRWYDPAHPYCLDWTAAQYRAIHGKSLHHTDIDCAAEYAAKQSS